jgi:hypothetical protein
MRSFPDIPRFPWTFVILLGVVGTAILPGCGSNRMPTAPVRGEVWYKGKPLSSGAVLFQPDKGPVAQGLIQSDGTFRLSTYSANDGAVLGPHHVQIACFETQSVDTATQGEPGMRKPLIPLKYFRYDTSGLSVEVRKQNEPLKFELAD